MNGYIIVVGNPVDGIRCYGETNQDTGDTVLWYCETDAVEYADVEFKGQDWWIAEVDSN